MLQAYVSSEDIGLFSEESESEVFHSTDGGLNDSTTTETPAVLSPQSVRRKCVSSADASSSTAHEQIGRVEVALVWFVRLRNDIFVHEFARSYEIAEMWIAPWHWHQIARAQNPTEFEPVSLVVQRPGVDPLGEHLDLFRRQSVRTWVRFHGASSEIRTRE